MTTTNPTLLAMPIAKNGTKNTIPETQAAAGNGLMSQSTGFPPETALPLGAGGIAPSREDFNGAFNLLGGVAFYAQKGWKFLYDNDQDYYAGCIVRDADDGKLYECVADMTAGTVAPHSDTANDYWKLYTSGLSRELIPAFNKRDVITTSGTYTAPVTGWYKITVKGGGGGGGGGASASGSSGSFSGGPGGGEGGTTIGYEHLDTGSMATVTIGAGGAGGASGGYPGTAGGDSSVVVNGNTYTGGGGKSSGIETTYFYRGGGPGGTGTIPGAPGGAEINGVGAAMAGASGGGNGGGIDSNNANRVAATNGGGGCGGGAFNAAGGNGGDGYVWFEYFAEV